MTGFQAKRKMAADKQQDSDDLTIAYMSGVHDGKASVKAERNFCSRCGKRLGKSKWDIHTCTPPSEAEKQEPVDGWNAALDYAARRVGEMNGFGKATQDSFAVFLQRLKK